MSLFSFIFLKRFILIQDTHLSVTREIQSLRESHSVRTYTLSHISRMHFCVISRKSFLPR